MVEAKNIFLAPFVSSVHSSPLDSRCLLHHLIQSPYRIQNFFMIAVARDTNIGPGD